MELQQICKKLLIKEPFWGLFLLGINKQYSNRVKTLAVVGDGLGVEIHVNKDFWDTLTDTEQTAVLLHELHHICFDHMFMAESFPDRELFNMAADLEVNCYIEGLPKGALDVEHFNFPAEQGTKWYYNQLAQQGKSPKGGGGGNSQLDENCPGLVDDHSTWKDFQDLSAAEQELVRNQVNAQLKEVANQIGQLPGNLPGDIKQRIDKLLKEKPRIYDWKAHLRRFLGTQIDLKFKKTYQRSSKRFPNTPGLKFKKRVSILVGIDTSGSVSDKELADFFSEILHLYKTGANIHIIECDTTISSEWDFQGLRNVTITGRGGTNFEPVINYFREHLKEYATLVFFTDGEASISSLKVPNNNMVWVITSNGSRQDYPGKVIYIPKPQITN